MLIILYQTHKIIFWLDKTLKNVVKPIRVIRVKRAFLMGKNCNPSWQIQNFYSLWSQVYGRPIIFMVFIVNKLNQNRKNYGKNFGYYSRL